MKVVCLHVRSYQEFLTERYEEQEEKRRRENEKWLRQIHNHEYFETPVTLRKKEPMPLPFLILGWLILILMCICKKWSSGGQGELGQVQQPRAVSLPTLGEAGTSSLTAPPITSPPPPSLPSPEIVPAAPTQVRVVYDNCLHHIVDPSSTVPLLICII